MSRYRTTVHDPDSGLTYDLYYGEERHTALMQAEFDSEHDWDYVRAKMVEEWGDDEISVRNLYTVVYDFDTRSVLYTESYGARGYVDEAWGFSPWETGPSDTDRGIWFDTKTWVYAKAYGASSRIAARNSLGVRFPPVATASDSRPRS